MTHLYPTLADDTPKAPFLLVAVLTALAIGVAIYAAREVHPAPDLGRALEHLVPLDDAAVLSNFTA